MRVCVIAILKSGHQEEKVIKKKKEMKEQTRVGNILIMYLFRKMLNYEKQ